MISFCQADPQAAARLIIRLRDQNMDEFSARMRKLEAERMRPDPGIQRYEPVTPEQATANLESATLEFESLGFDSRSRFAKDNNTIANTKPTQ